MESMKSENWKPAPYPHQDIYEVSDLGRVRCHKYGDRQRKNPRIKKTQLNTTNGYYYVILSVNKLIKNWTINRLVLTVFKGPRDKSIDARHLDGDKANNILSNLAWGTRRDNEADKKAHGRTPIGSSNGQSKLTENAVRNIRRRHSKGESSHSLATSYSVCQQTISAITTRKTWRHL